MVDSNKNRTRDIPKTLEGFLSFVLKEIVNQKKWLLLPLWILLLAIAMIIILGGSSSLLPAIYISF